MQEVTRKQVHDAALRCGGSIFTNNNGVDLNIIAIRSSDLESDTFNDFLITVSYLCNRQWVFFSFPATTDPGLYYRENPMNVKGTAILPSGVHKSLFKIGRHRGKYKALVQSREVGVWRDNDRDSSVDSGIIDTGFHGINIHRANKSSASKVVRKWSAGCQVIQDPAHFDLFVALCQRQVDTLGYKTFSYTLINEADLQ